MRFRRKRYDPWPDIYTAYMRLFEEVMDLGKRGELTERGVRGAMDAMRSTYESYTIYATVGKDRKKLGPDFAKRAEDQMRESVDWAKALA